MDFAQRVGSLEPEGAYVVLARAQELERKGRDIIHLEIGEPDFPTPHNIRNAGIAAIEEGKTRYNPPRGLPEFRQIIAEKAGAQRGIEISPEQIVVGPGAKPLLFFPSMALIDPGDEVIYPDPGFPTYKAMIEVCGGIPVAVPLVEEKGFSFDLDALERLWSKKTKLVIINSPGNPTGGVVPFEDLQIIAQSARERDVWILSDEIYANMAYTDGGVPSIAALPDMMGRTIIMDGFSKTYSMTGWRLGFGVMPVSLADKVQLLLNHAVGCTAHFTQFAGIEAFTGTQVDAVNMQAEYARRRDVMVEGLNAIPGVSCHPPEGAFYVFPNVSFFGRSSGELADSILEETGVALLPGTAFGIYGEGYLRLTYANSVENIERALDRLFSYFTSL